MIGCSIACKVVEQLLNLRAILLVLASLSMERSSTWSLAGSLLDTRREGSVAREMRVVEALGVSEVSLPVLVPSVWMSSWELIKACWSNLGFSPTVLTKLTSCSEPHGKGQEGRPARKRAHQSCMPRACWPSRADTMAFYDV